MIESNDKDDNNKSGGLKPVAMRILRGGSYNFIRIFIILIVFFVIYGIIFISYLTKAKVCDAEEAAPFNAQDFKISLQKALTYINTLYTNPILICTTVNAEAAKENLPIFLYSISSVAPILMKQILVFCLDSDACSLCTAVHDKALCIYMDLEVSSTSLAPNGQKDILKDYQRLTFGRYYSTKYINSHGYSVLPVDVDSIFLQNPFADGNIIKERPNDIALVQDISPFNFKLGDKSTINGGFIYFPSNTIVGEITKLSYSTIVINKIWEKSCRPELNEQMITNSAIRKTFKKYKKDFKPHVLPIIKYLNFCSTNCTIENFNSIQSFEELQKLDSLYSQDKKYQQQCGLAARQQWVFFHAACINRPNDVSKVVAAKAAVQRAVLRWVKSKI